MIVGRIGSSSSVTVQAVCLLMSTGLHFQGVSSPNNGAAIEGWAFTECNRNYLYCFSQCPRRCAAAGVFFFECYRNCVGEYIYLHYLHSYVTKKFTFFLSILFPEWNCNFIYNFSL